MIENNARNKSSGIETEIASESFVPNESGKQIPYNAIKPGTQVVFNKNPEDDLPLALAEQRLPGAPVKGETRTIVRVDRGYIEFEPPYFLAASEFEKYCTII